MNFNKVFLAGNLTRDIDIKHTGLNQVVANVGIAVNRKWRGADGQDREEVFFGELEIWGKTAETMAKYLGKGRSVFIEGRLKLDQYEDKDGRKQTKTRIVVDSFQFADSKGGAPAQAPRSAPRYEPDRVPVRTSGAVPPPSDIDVPFAPNMQWA